MKKQLLFLSILLISIASFSQNSTEEYKPNGKPHFDVFWNYNTDLTKNATKTSAFELTRAYLGYSYNFSESISAKVTFDIGNNNEGSAYTAYLKVAQLDWKASENVKLSMGLIGMKQFKDQENFWGYRYLFKSFQDQNGFGSSADLGINAEFKLGENLTANFLIANGEGYKNIQDSDGYHKFGGSLIFTPVEGLITKIYADTQNSATSDALTTLSLFAGYEMSNWRFGAEYNTLQNGKKYSSPIDNHNLDGFSVYSTYVINKKFEVFGRFDQLSSNTLVGETTSWNNSKDGNQIIAGVQYAPIKGLKFALNYQSFSFDNDALNTKSLVYLNAQFKL